MQNEFAKDNKLLIAFLLDSKKIKYKKDIAKALKYDPSSISRCQDENDVACRNLSEKICAEIKQYYSIDISDGKVISSENSKEQNQIIHSKINHNNIISNFEGKYDVQWVKIHDGILRLTAQIEVFGNGFATFNINDEIFAGTVSYKQGFLYFEFENINEKFYLIFEVGNTLNLKLLKYVPGIFTAIEGVLRFIYGSYCVLDNLGENEKDEERINLYFQYALSKSVVETDKNMSIILDIRIPIEHKAIQNIFSNSNNSFVGNWDEISRFTTLGGISVCKLQFLNNGKVISKGVGSRYPYEGYYEVKGNNLYIYYFNSKRNATVTISLSYTESQSIKFMVGSFIAPNTYDSGNIFATFVFIKETSPLYQNTEVGIHEPHTEVYKYYEEIGVINELRTENVKSYSMDKFKPLS